jgi:cysteine-rich repeat protein
MKRTVLLVLAALALSLPAADGASAGARQCSAPAHKSACRDLHGVLFGLCQAYCEALRCPNARDRRACEQLRKQYEKASKGAPPPCDEVEEPPVCGDGDVNQEGEQCDDGNNDSCDGCSFDCRTESCGDGLLCGAEECEAGDVCDDGQFCTEECTCPPPLPPPPPVFCGDSPAPECGGECPQGLTCTDLGILPFCECFVL